jgi:DNA-binding transcriptional LysR family regulator
VIRHGTVADARVIVKRLAASKRCLVAAPAYLAKHGVPRAPAELERHMAILYANRDSDWRFKVPRDGFVVVRPDRYLRVNNGIIMRDAALAGLGIALLPTFITGPEISRGALKFVDVGAATDSADIFVAYPVGRRSSAKVRALVDALRAAFGNLPPWDQAPSTGRKPSTER